MRLVANVVGFSLSGDDTSVTAEVGLRVYYIGAVRRKTSVIPITCCITLRAIVNTKSYLW